MLAKFKFGNFVRFTNFAKFSLSPNLIDIRYRLSCSVTKNFGWVINFKPTYLAWIIQVIFLLITFLIKLNLVR